MTYRTGRLYQSAHTAFHRRYSVMKSGLVNSSTFQTGSSSKRRLYGSTLGLRTIWTLWRVSLASFFRLQKKSTSSPIQALSSYFPALSNALLGQNCVAPWTIPVSRASCSRHRRYNLMTSRWGRYSTSTSPPRQAGSLVVSWIASRSVVGTVTSPHPRIPAHHPGQRLPRGCVPSRYPAQVRGPQSHPYPRRPVKGARLQSATPTLPFSQPRPFRELTIFSAGDFPSWKYSASSTTACHSTVGSW